MAHAVVLQPGHCHLTWQGFSRLGAAILPIILPIGTTAYSLCGIAPLPHQKLQDVKPAPFGSCFLCYQFSLEKKGGKCNLSAEQTFPRLLPSETSFVENFKVVANNLGWEGSKAKNAADLPSLYRCWKALASKKQMLCGK